MLAPSLVAGGAGVAGGLVSPGGAGVAGGIASAIYVFVSFLTLPSVVGGAGGAGGGRGAGVTVGAAFAASVLFL